MFFGSHGSVRLRCIADWDINSSSRQQIMKFAQFSTLKNAWGPLLCLVGFWIGWLIDDEVPLWETFIQSWADSYQPDWVFDMSRYDFFARRRGSSDGNVSLSFCQSVYHFGPDWNNYWMYCQDCTDIHSPQRMNPTDFGDPPHVALSSGQKYHLSSTLVYDRIPAKAMKCPSASTLLCVKC